MPLNSQGVVGVVGVLKQIYDKGPKKALKNNF